MAYQWLPYQSKPYQLLPCWRVPYQIIPLHWHCLMPTTSSSLINQRSIMTRCIKISKHGITTCRVDWFLDSNVGLRINSVGDQEILMIAGAKILNPSEVDCFWLGWKLIVTRARLSVGNQVISVHNTNGTDTNINICVFVFLLKSLFYLYWYIREHAEMWWSLTRLWCYTCNHIWSVKSLSNHCCMIALWCNKCYTLRSTVCWAICSEYKFTTTCDCQFFHCGHLWYPAIFHQKRILHLW